MARRENAPSIRRHRQGSCRRPLSTGRLTGLDRNHARARGRIWPGWPAA
jgi:hypothetical protein